MQPISSRQRLTGIAAIVSVHCALVQVIALFVLEPKIWGHIAYSQSILLAMYLAFGRGNAFIRGGLFTAGIATVVYCNMQAAGIFFGRINGESIWRFAPSLVGRTTTLNVVNLQLHASLVGLVLPTLCTCIVLVPLRPWLGSASSEPTSASERIHISDLFGLTFLAAVTLGCYQFERSGHFRGWEPRIGPLSVSTLVISAATIGCLLLVLSKTWWWIGAIAFTVSAYAQHQLGIEWRLLVIQWGVVLATLAALRLLQIRLHDNVPTNADG